MQPRQCFVYGTLKRGQCREVLWPRSPLAVVPAWIRGDLYTRPDYPALDSGSGRVLGELWQFGPGDIADVIRVLDQIEGTNQPGYPDLYCRVVIETYSPVGQPLGRASTYRYAQNLTADGFRQITPDAGAAPDSFVTWSQPQASR